MLFIYFLSLENKVEMIFCIKESLFIIPKECSLEKSLSFDTQEIFLHQMAPDMNVKLAFYKKKLMLVTCSNNSEIYRLIFYSLLDELAL